MNPNGTYESEVNRKIDRALATGQPTGEPIVDELASTQPKANSEFQQRLEETLIERLEARKKPMNNTVVVEPKTPRRRFSLPATLVAAMLAVLFGGVIFSGMYRAPNGNSAAPILSPERTAEAVAQVPFTPTALPPQMGEIDPFILSATAVVETATGVVLDLTRTADEIFLVPSESTQDIDPFALSATALVATSTQQVLDLTISPTPPPAEGLFITFTPVEPQVMVVTTTPMPVIDIVVAVQPIARGQVITEDMVAVRVFPEEYAPITAIGDVQAVVGQVASTDIVRELPVLSSMITDELAATTVPDNLVEIVVAVQPIARGQVITEDMVTLRAYLPDEVPVSAVTELEAVIGNIARTDIGSDQPILSGLIAEEISENGASGPDNLIEVVVAVQNIRKGQTVTEDMVMLRQWPLNSVPLNAVIGLDGVVGKIAQTDILSEQPVLKGLVDDNNLDAPSSAPMLPVGTRLVSFPLISVEGMDTEVQPGEWVDVLILDPEHWDVIARSALVVSVEFFPEETTIIVSVAVSPQDAVKIVGAVEAGESLSITPAVAQVSVVVAREDIAAGTTLTEAMLALAYYPADAVPVESFNAIADAAGMVANSPISQGYPVIRQPPVFATPTKTFTPSVTPTATRTPTPVSSDVEIIAASPTPFQYTIQTGDTLTGILRQYGYDFSVIPAIEALNPDIPDVNNLSAGSVLLIPQLTETFTPVEPEGALPVMATPTTLPSGTMPPTLLPSITFDSETVIVTRVGDIPPVISTVTPVMSDLSSTFGLCSTFTGENGAEVRVAPDTSSETVGTLPIATSVVISGQDTAGEWYYIRTSADIGLNGWVVKDEIIISCRGTDSNDLAVPTLLPTFTPVVTMLPTVPPPPNTTEVVLPLQIPRSEFDLHNTEFAKRLQPGDRIHVIGMLLYVEDGDELPFLTINNVANVLVTSVDAPNSITVAVSSEEVRLLNFYIEAQHTLIYIRGNQYLSSTSFLVATAPPDENEVPNITPTPILLCRVVTTNADGAIFRSHAYTDAPHIATVPPGTPLEVTQQMFMINEGILWYFASAQIEGQPVSGWVQVEDVGSIPGSVCPPLPDVEPTLPPTPTPQILCQVVVTQQDGLFVRSRATTQSSRVTTLPFGAPMNVLQQARGIDDGEIWYFITAQIDGQPISGWIPARNIRTQPGSVCPELPRG
jgi:flagella basal body P-ring formation protein FlgA